MYHLQWTQFLSDPNDDEEESIKWLSANETPIMTVREHWKKTNNWRRAWLAANVNPAVEVVFNEWPILKTPVAPILILMDFDELKLSSGQRILKWSQFFNIILEIEKRVFKDVNGKRLFSLQASEDITQSKSVNLFIIFGLLLYLISNYYYFF